MTDRTHPDSGFPIAYSHYATYAEYVEALHARIAVLEAQLEAIGAGGVSGPLMGQPQAMPDLSALTERGSVAWAGVDAQGLREGRWYMVTHDGVATLCEDRRDAEKEAKDADMAWPHSGPHRAVQLVEVGTAAAELHRQHARIAELEAQLEIGAGGVSGPLMGRTDSKERAAKAAETWLRDKYGAYRGHFAWRELEEAFLAGRASLAASAGGEPVAQPGDAEAILSEICDLFFIGKLARNESTILANIRNAIDHAGLLHAVERDLFPQPELPEDDDPYAAVDEGLPAPNSWAAKDEADYVAQFRAALAKRYGTNKRTVGRIISGETYV